MEMPGNVVLLHVSMFWQVTHHIAFETDTDGAILNRKLRNLPEQQFLSVVLFMTVPTMSETARHGVTCP